MTKAPFGQPFTVSPKEIGGAFGDVGTLLPLLLGAVAVGGLAPMPVLAGYGVFYVATALYYRLPIPVQPMKAVAALLVTGQLAAGELVACGLTIGVVLLLLGITGWITRLGRLVPQSVLTGLQLGLGIALAVVGVGLMASAPALAALTAMLLLALWLVPGCPSVVVALAAAVVLGQLLGYPGPGLAAAGAGQPFVFALPTIADFERSVPLVVLPQLTLTFTNAILLTALVAGDYFGDRAAHVTPARLSLTSGLANLLLVPLGAMPMCHGAGGLAAHVRFGARSGAAPLAIGLVLLALALTPAGLVLAAFASIPAAALGALLLFAAVELAFSRRLFDARPSCWPVIAVAAAATVWLDPFLGLVAGALAEAARLGVIRLLSRTAGS